MFPKPPSIQQGDFRRKRGKKTRGYRTLVKRKGKWFSIGGIAPRGIALKLGETHARRTLAASFKAQPTNVELETGGDTAYKAPAMFRGYRVSRGHKIPLVDEFIQRSRFRLSAPQERREIRLARTGKRGGLSQYLI